MRRIDNTRRVLKDVAERESFDSKIKLGYISTPYQGGKFVHLSLGGDSGFAQVTASIPPYIRTPSPRPINSPVLVRVRRGFAEVLTWPDLQPIIHFSDSDGESVGNATIQKLGVADADVVRDDLGMVDVANNQVIISADYAGLWRITSNGKWASNATGHRRLYIYINTIAATAEQSASVEAVEWPQKAVIETVLNAGDIVDFRARQTSGGALMLSSYSWYMEYLRP